MNFKYLNLASMYLVFTFDYFETKIFIIDAIAIIILDFLKKLPTFFIKVLEFYQYLVTFFM